jgi:hypothetical protein
MRLPYPREGDIVNHLRMSRPRAVLAWATTRIRATAALAVVAAGVGMFGAAPATAAAQAPAVATPSVTRSCAVSTSPTEMECMALRRTDVAAAKSLAANATPSGYGPFDLWKAYGLPVAAGGIGTTVAIVDAFDDPSAESDLSTYRAQYGLPSCTTANGCFSKVNQSGAASPLPSADSSWGEEISVDLDMVSATCPHCRILLVEANTNRTSDLYPAVSYAAAHTNYVSDSWGTPEFSGAGSNESTFDHTGVVMTFSAGDTGTGPAYPATSEFVTAVGGTSLTRASNARGWTETAWAGSGSGCSTVIVKPNFEQSSSAVCGMRAETDVSAVADPSTGVAVYDSFGGDAGWEVFGGTSVAAPIIASVYALAGTGGSADFAVEYPYFRSTKGNGNLNDVTSGSNGSCGTAVCNAGPGWDGPTGLGTPNGVDAFSDLTALFEGDQDGEVSQGLGLTVSANGGTPPYTWSASGLPAGLSINSSTGVISGTPTTAGSSTVTYHVEDAVAATDQNSFTLTVSGPMPELVGDTLSQATARLHALELGTPRHGTQVDCGAVGQVTNQDPAAGTPEPVGFAAFLTIGVRSARPCP